MVRQKAPDRISDECREVPSERLHDQNGRLVDPQSFPGVQERAEGSFGHAMLCHGNWIGADRHAVDSELGPHMR
jgi:hypothetical protein